MEYDDRRPHGKDSEGSFQYRFIEQLTHEPKWLRNEIVIMRIDELNVESLGSVHAMMCVR